MDRIAHTLSKLSTNTMPEHIIFVDTETTPVKLNNKETLQNLKLGVAVYLRYRRDRNTQQRVKQRFTIAKEFWDFVLARANQKSVMYLVSHNAVFDFTVLKTIENLTKAGYKCKFVFEGGVAFIAKWWRKGHSIVILDNANWFAGKLEKWGKELNLPKLTMPKKASTQEKWFTYCERDTEILVQLFLWYVKFLQSNNLGSWRYTIASSAFTAYRHRFMKHPIYIPNDANEQKLARESYHGGRVEVFRVGEYNNELFYKIDVNSMYPYVMQKNLYPVAFHSYHKNVSVDATYKMLTRYGCIARVVLCTKIPYFVNVQNNRNIYPTGTFTSVLCTQELRLAIETQSILEIREIVFYRQRMIFTEYVDFFYRVKLDSELKGQTLLRSFAKLYYSALYGKFGQRGYIDKVIGNTEHSGYEVSYGYNVRTGQRFTLRQVGKQLMYSERAKEGFNSFCGIASHVAADARLYLYDLVLIASRKNCYYCDTDSIIVNQKGYDKLSSLMDKQKLGYLKLEEQTDSIAVLAPKHYRIGNDWKRKGIRKNAKEIGINHYRQEVWPGFNTMLKRGIEEYVVKLQDKKLNPCIISGVVDVNGYVHPFQL